jgi:predicted alpha/beta hydrolase family esterase
MRCWLIYFILAIQLMAKTVCSQPIIPESLQLKSKTFSENLNYLLYKPLSYTSTKKWPLIVYLHGGGSIDSDINRIRTMGLPRLTENGLSLPAILLAPQLQNQKNWLPKYVDEYIREAVSSLSVDENKIYITGISLGAVGVWQYCAEYPDKVTAAIPVSGWGNPNEVCKIKNIPVWAFHGNQDRVVAFAGSKNMIDELKKCDGDARLTIIEDGGHEIWEQAYLYPRFTNWLFSQSKVKKPIPASIDTVGKVTLKAHPLPKALRNITGLISVEGGAFIGINEQDALPVILKFDTSGHISALYKIQGSTNLSWQDITISDESIFIGDIGNPKYNRQLFQVYKIFNQLNIESVPAEKIEFRIMGFESLDFHALFFFQNSLYLIGQSQNKLTYLVKVNITPGLKSAEILCEVPSLNNTAISSAQFDKLSGRLWVLGSEWVGYYTIINAIEEISQTKPEIWRLPDKRYLNALTVLPNGKIAMADQFFLGGSDGRLYILN